MKINSVRYTNCFRIVSSYIWGVLSLPLFIDSPIDSPSFHTDLLKVTRKLEHELQSLKNERRWCSRQDNRIFDIRFVHVYQNRCLSLLIPYKFCIFCSAQGPQ